MIIRKSFSQLEKELSTLTPEQRQQVMDYYNR